jgi:oligoribonuclease NrnB/cAMP/cGMP phosphodiesterase (DHH superfamily)
MTDTLVLYHASCADGFAAALAVWLKHPEWDFHAIHYGDALPPHTGYKHLVMVDFSFKRPGIIELANLFRTILILDHHETAKDELVGLPYNVKVVFDTNQSGAVLTWEHYHPSSTAPQLLLHIQDRDLWKFELKDTKEVSAALMLNPFDFEVWTMLLRPGPKFQRLIHDGEVLLAKQDLDIDRIIDNWLETPRYIMFEDHKVPVLNYTQLELISETLHRLIEESHCGVAASWLCKGDSYVYSVRSNDGSLVAAKDVALSFGGGGHRNAAGFELDYLLTTQT